jgi:hemolysin activation/secretion protein
LNLGDLDINDAEARNTDARGGRTAGGFGKITIDLDRVQSFTPNLKVSLSLSGQLANKNLDSSEDFFLGGANGVRAYPRGEGAGDEGVKLTTELMWRVPKWSRQNYGFSLVNFYDFGWVRINRDPYDDAVNQRSLAGCGLGTIWAWKNCSFRWDYAFKLGNEQAVFATTTKYPIYRYFGRAGIYDRRVDNSF